MHWWVCVTQPADTFYIDWSWSQVTRERIRQIEAKAIRQLRARQTQPGSVMADYQLGGMEHKELASRTSSGTKKQG